MKQRAISIKGERNTPYSHAIFILKDKQPAVIDFVAEAERLLDLKKGTKAKIIEEGSIKKIIIQDSSFAKILLNLTLFLSSVALIAGMVLVIFGYA